MTQFKTGQTVELHKPARPYEHMGIIDRNYLIPETTEQLRIVRVTRGGDRLTLRRSDNTGYGIILSQWLTRGNTIRVVSEKAK
jgi:hypothetical protein